MNYVTEKFFYTYAFDEGPLPVALGGYSLSDYSKYDINNFFHLRNRNLKEHFYEMILGLHLLTHISMWTISSL